MPQCGIYWITRISLTLRGHVHARYFRLRYVTLFKPETLRSPKLLDVVDQEKLICFYENTIDAPEIPDNAVAAGIDRNAGRLQRSLRKETKRLDASQIPGVLVPD